MKQAAPAVLMIRPVNFGYNAETAATNSFQIKDASVDGRLVQEKALAEFNAFVDTLRGKDVEVVVFEDTPDPFTPDSIFPNNWLSFHDDGTVILYPMYAANRRLERRGDILVSLQKNYNFDVKKIIDFSYHELNNRFLEGTGSIVFDYNNKLAFACHSPRTDADLLKTIAYSLHFEPILFHALDSKQQPIYHTNVVMCLGEQYAVICMECIPDETEKANLKNRLEQSGHEIIEITYQQLVNFAGNMLEVETKKGEKLLLMSDSAWKTLSEEQKNKINKYVTPFSVPIATIERHGGGSVRCMLAGIFLPKLKIA